MARPPGNGEGLFEDWKSFCVVLREIASGDNGRPISGVEAQKRAQAVLVECGYTWPGRSRAREPNAASDPQESRVDCVHRTIGRDGNPRPFRLRRAGAALLDRFCRCWKRHTEVGRLSVVTEVDFRDYASSVIVSHCPTLPVWQRETPPSGRSRQRASQTAELLVN